MNSTTQNNKRIFNFDVMKFMAISVMIGCVIVQGYSFRFIWGNASGKIIFKDWISASSTGIMIGGAGFMLGAFLGFLFAIPKILQNNAQAEEANLSRKSIYTHNDNLVQISDWLTKIIVGVSLTQINQLPEALDRLGNSLMPSFGNDLLAKNMSITIILYFLICGFLISYLWTRLYFIKMLAETDQELDRIRAMEKEKEQIQEELDKERNNKKEEIKDILKVAGMELNAGTDHPELWNTDHHKNAWGGSPVHNNRILSAIVEPTTWDENLFKIVLEVKSISITQPLLGSVTFHIHPTFKNPDPTVVVSDGVARLTLVSYGAFTVGAEADNGKTKLELDLSDLPGVSDKFRLK